MLNDNAYKQLQEMLNEAEQAHDFLEKSVEGFTYCIHHDVLKLLVQDALRWHTARQCIAIEDVEDWKSWPKFHDHSEDENVKADKAIDEFMESKSNTTLDQQSYYSDMVDIVKQYAQPHKE